MKNAAVTLTVAAALMLGLSTSANAQAASASAQATTTTMPTFELSGGYQFLRAGEVCGDETLVCSSAQSFPIGLAIDAARNFGALGIVGEAGWSVDSDSLEDLFDTETRTNLFHFAAGLRWTGRGAPTVWPYAQVLAGALVNHVSTEFIGGESSDTNTHFMVQPGAGVTFVVGDGWGIFGQVDYRRIFLNEDEDGVSGRNDVRVFVGVRMILD